MSFRGEIFEAFDSMQMWSPLPNTEIAELTLTSPFLVINHIQIHGSRDSCIRILMMNRIPVQLLNSNQRASICLFSPCISRLIPLTATAW